jgi:pimeloyl-ACP methyl ester carboxylesterase
MRINYTVKGEGPTLILLHGWGGSIKSLENLQTRLADMGFQVFNVDLPGFGESGKPGKALVLDDYVNYIHELIEKLNIYKPIIAGHSFGGKVAAAFAIKYPNLPSRLVLIDSSGLNPRNGSRKKFFLVTSKVFGSIFMLPGFKPIKPFFRKLYYKFIVRERDYLEADGLRATLKNILAENLDQKLRLIKADTLLIWGEFDKYTPLWMGQEMTRLIKGSRLEVVAGARHALPLDEPDIVAKIIYTFLNS